MVCRGQGSFKSQFHPYTHTYTCFDIVVERLVSPGVYETILRQDLVLLLRSNLWNGVSFPLGKQYYQIGRD